MHHQRSTTQASSRHLSIVDQERVRLFSRGPILPVPNNRIHQAFEFHATSTPDAVAAEHRDETISYGELDRQANRLAAELAELGVRPGDRVGLFLRRSIPMLVGLLGILKAGAAYVPQDVVIAPRAQLAHVIDTAATRIVLTASGFEELIPLPAGATCVAIDAVMAEPADDAPPPQPSTADGCYVLFTSGTTGKPNGVLVTHRNVCNLLLTAPGDLGIRPGWRVGQLLNIAFDMAAWEILGCLSHGATLVIRDGDIAAVAADVDVIIATPSVLGAIDPNRCARVKVVAVAGEPCPQGLADRWAGRCTFYNGCGPTETTIVNTMHRHEKGARVTIGRPTPNNTVYVLDEQGRECGVGQTGEMWAGGDGVSAGYLGDPELTAERYAPDVFRRGGELMFRTRDLGRWTADGELEHLGRTDDQVKVRGFRVELDSVSAAIESVPGCIRAATLKVDDRSLVSFVCPGDVDTVAVAAAVAAALPYYCVPSAVYAVDRFPETSNGKIDKQALLALAITADVAS